MAGGRRGSKKPHNMKKDTPHSTDGKLFRGGKDLLTGAVDASSFAIGSAGPSAGSKHKKQAQKGLDRQAKKADKASRDRERELLRREAGAGGKKGPMSLLQPPAVSAGQAAPFRKLLVGPLGLSGLQPAQMQSDSEDKTEGISANEDGPFVPSGDSTALAGSPEAPLPQKESDVYPASLEAPQLALAFTGSTAPPSPALPTVFADNGDASEVMAEGLMPASSLGSLAAGLAVPELTPPQLAGTLSYLAPADAASGAPWQSIEQVSAAANPLIALYPSHDARWYSTSAGKLEPASSDTDAAGEEFSSESLDAMAAFCQAEEMRSSIEAAPDHSGSGPSDLQDLPTPPMLSVCELSASCNPLIGLWGCRLGEDSPRSMPLGAADVFNPSAGAPESPLAPTAYTAEEPFYLEQLFHLDSALTNEGKPPLAPQPVIFEEQVTTTWEHLSSGHPSPIPTQLSNPGDLVLNIPASPKELEPVTILTPNNAVPVAPRQSLPHAGPPHSASPDDTTPDTPRPQPACPPTEDNTHPQPPPRRASRGWLGRVCGATGALVRRHPLAAASLVGLGLGLGVPPAPLAAGCQALGASLLRRRR